MDMAISKNFFVVRFHDERWPPYDSALLRKLSALSLVRTTLHSTWPMLVTASRQGQGLFHHRDGVQSDKTYASLCVERRSSCFPFVIKPSENATPKILITWAKRVLCSIPVSIRCCHTNLAFFLPAHYPRIGHVGMRSR